MDNASEVIAKLTQRLDALENRVRQLEQSSDASRPASSILQAPKLEPAHPAAGTSPSPPAASIFTTLGTAILGMAGAYLLRAFAESGSLPRPLIVILAIVYAMLWLGAASRVRTDRVFARFAYALTSALILAPMLWELTLRFRVLSPALTATVLAIFAIAALALSWTAANPLVFWIACVTASGTALGLMIATQDLPPFLVALLLIAAATEFASLRGRLSKTRILTALALDLATASLLYIYSLDPAARPGYRNLSEPWLIALSSAPFLLYLIINTLYVRLRKRALSLFDITQGTLTLLLALYGATRFTAAFARQGAGASLLCIAAALYAIAFTINRQSSGMRTIAAFATWGAATLAAGGILLLPHAWLSVLLVIAAIASTIFGVQNKQPVLEYHAALYLLAAAFLSNLAAFDLHALLSPAPDGPGWSISIILLGSLVCYGITLRSLPENLDARIPRFAMAALAAINAAAYLAYALSSLQNTLRLGAAPNATGTHPFLQTLSLCIAGLALALASAHIRHRELLWLAYTAVALAAAKILLHDVGHEGLTAIAATFVLYAATLILMPRITGNSRKTAPVPPARP